MTLQDRIKYFRTQIASSPELLCEELQKQGIKMSAPTIYGYENGHRQPSVAYISALVKAFDANPSWLLNGNGEMFLSEESKLKNNLPANLDLTNISFIPMIDMSVSAGYGSVIEQAETTEDFISFGKDWLKNNTSTTPENLIIFKVRGDSMDGGSSRIKDGSLILTDISINEYINDGIYVINIDNALFVKRLQFVPGKLIIKSDNPTYDSFEVDLKSNYVKIIGVVIYAFNRVSCM